MIGNKTGRQVCEECNIQFPKGKRFVAPFIVGDEGTKDLCSLCALKLTRKIHNNQEYYFQGKANRKRHKNTVEFLKKAGVDVPAELDVQTF